MATFLIIAAAIALQILLTARKLSPFLSLLVVAIPMGLALGIAPQDLVRTIDAGVGSTLAGLALVIVLGAILGKVLEESGAAEKIATTLIGAFGERNIQWALLLTGFLVGIPLYFNAGFIILVPLVFSLARRTGLPILLLAIPTVASLSTTHCFLPPHPGPVVLVNAFGADMGRTLLYGLVMAVPAVVIAGPWLSRRLKSINPPLPDLFNGPEDGARGELPGAPCSFLIALSPVLLISVSVVADGLLPEGLVRTALLFLGNPTVALLLSTLLAFWFLGHRRGVGLETQTRWLNAAIGGIAVILLIITAGGVFKQVLVDSGVGATIAALAGQWQMPPLLFAWLATALLRVMIGSSTVAVITAAGVVGPLVESTGVSPELMVLAVGAGSVFGSHVNDSAFWMFKEFFGLSMAQTFRSWTVMESTISVVGLAGVLLLDLAL
ncbi:gluconate transporter [Pseudoxanthomonas sp. SGNA-20]|uniref:gluconate:H+ symporter n=1 Tax=unclassified Pseudoxanthomonas TaxID=2645906 RepID=UPI0002F87958|nr:MULTISPECIES: gluconate:H+ symporter [unclassified Pseudoxanthomonas]RRN55478.1 gluconate transporter [Pseudoxanthomonas sp. SGNA-20]RRN79554.1 gluconate transporter [Pseudoxanthomonas sp. SGD-10]